MLLEACVAWRSRDVQQQTNWRTPFLTCRRLAWPPATHPTGEVVGDRAQEDMQRVLSVGGDFLGVQAQQRLALDPACTSSKWPGGLGPQ